MKLIIHIQNNLATAKQQVVLLDGMFTNGKLEEGVTGTVDIIDDENKDAKIRTIEYSDLVKQTDHVPYEIKITETSNNRQIDFYFRNRQTLQYGYKYKGRPYIQMEPGLTKDGKKRKQFYSVADECYKYTPEWNPEEWNIADTHELFILDNKVVFELCLKPKQKFSIYVDVSPKMDTNKMLEEMPKLKTPKPSWPNPR